MNKTEIEDLVEKRGKLVDSIKQTMQEIGVIEKQLKDIEYPAKCTYLKGGYEMTVSMVRTKKLSDALLTAKIEKMNLNPVDFKVLVWDFDNETLKALATDDVKIVGSVSQRVTFK